LTVFHFSVVFAVTLASRYFCFKHFDRVKRVIFQASDIAKSISVLLIFKDIARTEDFRKRYLYLLKVVDEICCLRTTRIKLNNLKWFEQNDLLLKGRLVNRNWSLNKCPCRNCGSTERELSDLNSACSKVLVPVKIFQFQDMGNESEGCQL
jgi:hypothetical protein